MTQSNFEKNGGTYTKVGDYLIPDLTLPPEEQNVHLGVFGMRHKRYLMENQRVAFNIFTHKNKADRCSIKTAICSYFFMPFQVLILSIFSSVSGEKIKVMIF